MSNSGNFLPLNWKFARPCTGWGANYEHWMMQTSQISRMTLKKNADIHNKQVQAEIFISDHRAVSQKVVKEVNSLADRELQAG